MDKTYQTPEVVELGAAETLTLGNRGCAADGYDCSHNPLPAQDTGGTY